MDNFLGGARQGGDQLKVEPRCPRDCRWVTSRKFDDRSKLNRLLLLFELFLKDCRAKFDGLSLAAQGS
jgi:hypothetical protein